MPTFVLRAALVVLVLLAAMPRALAEDARQNGARQFDFYVLTLSWSPSFCAAAAERDSARAPTLQCGARPYSFVVHGLWPQYEKGFPEYCQVPVPRLYRGIVSSMLDLMPAPRLIYNEWDKHGTCSGLAPRAYFDTVRKARAMVKIPTEYTDLQEFAQRHAGLSRGCFHQSKSKSLDGGYGHRVRQEATDRRPHLLVEGAAIPQLRPDRAA